MDNMEQILETNTRLNNIPTVGYSLGVLLMAGARRGLLGAVEFDGESQCIGQ